MGDVNLIPEQRQIRKYHRARMRLWMRVSALYGGLMVAGLFLLHTLWQADHAALADDLQASAQQGQFRMDLYYRVAVIPLVIPPLRDRPQDILKLADYFITKHQKKDDRELKTLNLPTQQILRRYHWPGNIRELENAIEHALAMSRGAEITPDCFPLQILAPEAEVPTTQNVAGPIPDVKGKTKKQEREFLALTEVLTKHEGDLAAAARELGVSRVTLWRKRKRYNL